MSSHISGHRKRHRQEKPLTPKQLLRRHARQLRDSFPLDKNEKHSRTIAHHLMDVIRARNFQTVMIYFHFGSEVRTHHLFEQLKRDGRIILGPAIFPGRRLEPYRVIDPERDLVIDRFGVPTPDVKRCEHYDPQRLECIVVPGIAFDRKGCRIGYGAGYYDRFLARCPHAHTIGAAFGFQIVETTFPEAWDQPVRQVATEHEIIDCDPRGALKCGQPSSDNTDSDPAAV